MGRDSSSVVGHQPVLHAEGPSSIEWSEVLCLKENCASVMLTFIYVGSLQLMACDFPGGLGLLSSLQPNP